MMHGSALDSEWVQLMTEARDIGLSLQEIRDFLGSHVKENTAMEE